MLLVTPELAERLSRAVGLARVAAYSGRLPQVLEDANVILARMADGAESGTTGAAPVSLDGWVTCESAAGRLGCSARAIRRAIAERRLAATKFGGVWLIQASDLERYRFRRTT
ncbi:helix-turn-helix domain-containing protein [uncultured Microbacterium sp.]|uniref:helix-turn-helix domain-containing protein n=1 Tax=uncultured Microbacterium sp. TaxID=191216 RepID=UPI0025D98DBB|nr:helix-turn-helix domain-containing protein [uncultured Microbacterium sp.]